MNHFLRENSFVTLTLDKTQSLAIQCQKSCLQFSFFPLTKMSFKLVFFISGFINGSMALKCQFCNVTAEFDCTNPSVVDCFIGEETCYAAWQGIPTILITNFEVKFVI